MKNLFNKNLFKKNLIKNLFSKIIEKHNKEKSLYKQLMRYHYTHRPRVGKYVNTSEPVYNENGEIIKYNYREVYQPSEYELVHNNLLNEINKRIKNGTLSDADRKAMSSETPDFCYHKLIYDSQGRFIRRIPVRTRIPSVTEIEASLEAEKVAQQQKKAKENADFYNALLTYSISDETFENMIEDDRARLISIYDTFKDNPIDSELINKFKDCWDIIARYGKELCLNNNNFEKTLNTIKKFEGEDKKDCVNAICALNKINTTLVKSGCDKYIDIEAFTDALPQLLNQTAQRRKDVSDEISTKLSKETPVNIFIENSKKRRIIGVNIIMSAAAKKFNLPPYNPYMYSDI